MKVAINQAAALTTTGTQNWTDASISSDFIAELFIDGAATANDTATAAGKVHLGCSDGTNDYATGIAIQDASATPNAQMRSFASSILNIGSNGSVQWAAARTATLSNGITETYSAAAASPPLIAGLSFAGSDFELMASTVSFTTTDTAKTFTHNCTGTPAAFILMVDMGESGINVGGATNWVIGFYESGGGTAGGLAFRQTHATAPTVVSALINNDLGHQITATTDAATFSISGIGATQLTLNRTAAGAAACTCILYSMRAKTGTLVAKAGVFTNPTSTGNFSPVTGMAGKPQVLITVGTRLTTSGTIQTDDSTGSVSIGLLCNNAGTLQQATVASTTKQGVNPSVAKSQSSINKSMAIVDNTGALQFTATGVSADSAGWTLNCGQNTGSVAAKTAYLAFGVVTAGALLSMASNNGGF